MYITLPENKLFQFKNTPPKKITLRQMNRESLKTYRFCHTSRKQVFYFNLKTLRQKKITLCQMNGENHWKDAEYAVCHASKKQVFHFQFKNRLAKKNHTLPDQLRMIEDLPCTSRFQKISFFISIWKHSAKKNHTSPIKWIGNLEKISCTSGVQKASLFISISKALPPKKSHFFLCE